MKPTILTRVFFIFLLPALSLKAQSPDLLKKAWASFYLSKNEEAAQYFDESIKKDPHQTEAYMGKILLESWDDFALKSIEWSRQFIKNVKDPNPFIRILIFTSIFHEKLIPPGPEAIQFMKELALDQRLNGTNRALIDENLGTYYHALNNREDEKKYFSRIGGIRDWSLIGDFNNISSSGFNKDCEIIHNADDKKTYMTKSGAVSGWFIPSGIRPDSWIDFTYNYYHVNSLFFAQTFIYSPEPKAVQIRMGAGGSVKAWLNDQRIIEDNEERNNDLDSYIVDVHLNKGFNRVLVQIGESYGGLAGFYLRVTDSLGNPIHNLKINPHTSPYTNNPKGTLIKANVNVNERYFTQLSGQNETLNALLRGLNYMVEQKYALAKKTLIPVSMNYPNFIFVHSLLSEIDLKLYNNAASSSEISKIKKIDPESPYLLINFMKDNLARRNFILIKRKIAKLRLSKNETYQFVANMLQLTMTKMQSDQKGYAAVINEVYNRYPNFRFFVILKMDYEQNYQHDPKATQEVLSKYLKVNYDYGLIKQKAEQLLGLGKVSEAIKVLEIVVRKDPESYAINEMLQNFYFEKGRLDKALEESDKCLKIAPQISELLLERAKILDRMEDKENASAYYVKAMQYSPEYYSVLDNLKKIKGQAPISSYLTDANIDSIINLPYTSDSTIKFNSVYLYNGEQKIVYPFGGSTERYEYVVRVLNKAGIEDWKEQNINASDELVLADVIKSNGDKIKADSSGNQVVFTNLEVGDAIHVIYKRNVVRYGKLSRHFWDDFAFSHYIPCLESRYELLVPTGTVFKWKFSKSDGKPMINKKDDFTLYTWKDENLPGIDRSVEFMPEDEDLKNYLYVSSLPDWQFVSQWYYDLASSRAVVNDDVTGVMDSLFKGKVLSEVEKLGRIYKYVTHNITYSSVSFRQSGFTPQRPSAVINTQLGDCKDVSTLFITLCKSVGIKANLVLVNTRDHGLDPMPLPSIDFNHCMVKVKINNTDRYFELTSSTLPIGSLYSSDIDSRILEIDSSSGPKYLEFLNPVNRVINGVYKEKKLIINKNKLVFEERNILTGAEAAFMRAKFSQKTSTEQKKMIKERIPFQDTKIKIVSLSIKNLTEENDSVNNLIRYTVDDEIANVGSTSLFKIPWSHRIDQTGLDPSESRKYPIDFGGTEYPDIESERLTFSIPTGYHLNKIPLGLQLKLEGFSYSLSFSIKDSKLIGIRSYHFDKRIIPLEKTRSILTGFEKAIMADNQKIVISKN